VVLVAGLAGSVHSERTDAAADADAMAPGKIEFVGVNFFSTANGTFHRWRVIESRFDVDAVDESYAVVEVDLSSVDTGIERRDEHLRTADFFDIENHPVATVRAHSLVAKGESEAGNPIFDVVFDIDLHGVERMVPGEVEILDRAPPLLEGRLVVNRLDFEVGPPERRWNPMSIGAEIPVEFRIEL
jgi:polyisoprenoid-binding protein YceI